MDAYEHADEEAAPAPEQTQGSQIFVDGDGAQEELILDGQQQHGHGADLGHQQCDQAETQEHQQYGLVERADAAMPESSEPGPEHCGLEAGHAGHEFPSFMVFGTHKGPNVLK